MSTRENCSSFLDTKIDCWNKECQLSDASTRNKYTAYKQQKQYTLTVNFEILRLLGHRSGQSAEGGSHSSSSVAVQPCSNIHT